MSGVAKWGWHNYKITTVDNLGRKIVGFDRSHAWAAAENLYQWLSSNRFISKNANYVIKNLNDSFSVAKRMYGKNRGSALLFFDYYGNIRGRKRHFYHVALLGQVLKWTNNKYYIYYYAHTGDSYGECYMQDGSYSPAYLQNLFVSSYYINLRVYVYYL